MLRFVAAIPRMAVTALIVLAIVNLLIGVIFRYFVGALTYYLDLDPIPFTWVEEVGEIVAGMADTDRCRHRRSAAVAFHSVCFRPSSASTRPGLD